MFNQLFLMFKRFKQFVFVNFKLVKRCFYTESSFLVNRSRKHGVKGSIFFIFAFYNVL